MNPIDDLFRRLRAGNRKAFMPFVTAGDPDLAFTRDLLPAVAAGADLVVAVGPDAVGIADGALAAGAREGDTDGGAVRVPDRDAARRLLTEVLVPGDVVLVKASRSYGLEVLAADLLSPGAGA